MDASLLYEKAENLVGEKIITVIKVKDTGYDSIKANTDAHDENSVKYDIVFNFSNSDYIDGVKNEDVYTIAGTVESVSTTLGKTVEVEDCTIIGTDEMISYLTSTIGEQAEQITKRAAALAAECEAALQEEISSYKETCETVAYRDIERNPETYNGTHLIVTGKVVQVSEGWFDTVTLRVEDNNGDVWYITYTRNDGESRILEDDLITCYGECDGVESYTSVLGNQVTIPSVDMKYYEIN